MSESRPNLIAITPNCFLIRTQAGFNKLCKKLNCRQDRGKSVGKFYYWYKICQHTNDERAYYNNYYKKYDENGYLIKDKDGNIEYDCIKQSVQYPIKYPLILSYQDETFDCSMYYFHIRYIKDELTIKDIESLDIDKIFDE